MEIGINWNTISEFITLLTGDENSPLAWRIFHDSSRHETGYNIGGSLNQIKSRLVAWQKSGNGVFITINGMVMPSDPSSSWRMKQTSAQVNCLRACVIDFDNIPIPAKWEIEPNFLTVRDETHFHAWFLLKEESSPISNAELWKQTQYRLALFYDGDIHLTDLPRVIRVPGTLHQKQPIPILTRLIKLSDPTKEVSLQELEQAHPLSAADEALCRSKRILVNLSVNREPDLYNDEAFTMDLATQILSNIAPPIKFQGSNHHIYRVSCQIQETGLTLEKARTLIGKWAERGEGYRADDEDIYQIILNAYRYSQKGPLTHSMNSLVKEGLKLSEEEKEDLWKNALDVDSKTGLYKKNYRNLLLIFHHDPRLKDCFFYEEFSDTLLVRNHPPHLTEPLLKPRPIEDFDLILLRGWFSMHYRGLEMLPSDFDSVIIDLGRKCKINAVKEYIESTQWDGIPRLKKWLSTYLGCANNWFEDEIGEKVLVAAVTRIYEPGAKWDYMIMLEGHQGQQKSWALEALGGNWFSSLTINPESKDMLMRMRGAWIVEVGELKGLNTADLRQIKSFISEMVDEYRKPYDRKNKKYPRQCIMFGTTNEYAYLKDDTGNRRYIITPVLNEIKLEALKEDRDQIWAEAYQRYKEKFVLKLTNELEKENAIRTNQRHISSQDPWKDIVLEFAETQMVDKGFVTIKDIYIYGLEAQIQKCSKLDEMRIATILKINNFKSISKWIKNSSKNVWIKND